jgi:hypothetical protein
MRACDSFSPAAASFFYKTPLSKWEKKGEIVSNLGKRKGSRVCRWYHTNSKART